MCFKQQNWFKVFTDFNTKNLYKLFNNCIYGKSTKNCRKKINVKLVNDNKKYQKIVNNPTFMSQKIIDKNLVAVHCKENVLTLNKPIYIGFCILELSKFLMY